MTVDEPSEVLRRIQHPRHLELRLNRPHVHNAIDVRLRDELVAVLTATRLAPDRARIALLGDGPSFCSGGDLTEFGVDIDPVTNALVRLGRSLPAAAAGVSDRLVVGVHGACIGAGIELAAFATTIVAAEDAWFQLPELAMGLIPGAGGTVSIPRRIGRGRTLHWLLSGDRLDAASARSWGLVDMVVPRDDLHRAVEQAVADVDSKTPAGASR